ncbi:hypothetical protein L1281_000663 [Neisseria sp. HSC-16F19]|nr:hypothetical protein [Neisseria sp. HSC-16F19]MCP2040083.1 hypothetical protein [Neisseria sp. HSC-16F19]
MNTEVDDFFDLSTNNGEPVRADPLFGICDDGCGENKEKPAYTDVEFPKKWIATVQNRNNIEIQFYAIDKRIKILINGDEQSLCDGMLTFSDDLYLVELKIQKTGMD